MTGDGEVGKDKVDEDDFENRLQLDFLFLAWSLLAGGDHKKCRAQHRKMTAHVYEKEEREKKRKKRERES